MCAIISSNNISKLEVLYEANVERGNFSTGIVGLYDQNEQQVFKKQGTVNFDQVKLDNNCNYYICHAQAPTSAKRTWSYDTSHPFESLSWSVVHNGIITNEQELRKKFVPWDLNPVDTSVISSLLQYITEDAQETLPNYVIVEKTLELLQGTFALCIIDTDCNDVFIARQGSVLHYNDKGDVSTLGGEGFHLLPEGTIMRLKNYNKWETIGTFKTQSPFLFI